MHISLMTLEGKELLTAREIINASKINTLVTVEKRDNWVFFKEVDPKTVNRNQKYLQINVSSECTDGIAGVDFGSFLHNIEKASFEGMVAFDDHCEVSSTGTKYYTYITEVVYAEIEAKYNKKMLFGIHAPLLNYSKRTRKNGHVTVFDKGWYTVQEINSIPSQFEDDMADAERWGAKLTYKVYAPAMK